jgi:hypothetical protein
MKRLNILRPSPIGSILLVTFACVSIFVVTFISENASAQVTLFESTGEDTKPPEKNHATEESQSHSALITNASDDVGVPRLKEKLKDGTYVYDAKESSQTEGATVHFGKYTLKQLSGDTPGVTYQSVYSTSTAFIITVDYEHQFFKNFGKLGLKTGVGFFTAKGFGRFAHTQTQNLPADTQYTLYAIPLSLGPVYHLQFWERQILVPYAEGGGDYFSLIEYRDDKTAIGESLKFGGAAAAHWAAGVQIQLDFLDRHGVWNLDHSYGINHIYLTADFRQIVGLSSTYDFSGTIYEGGIFVEF